MAMFVYKKNQSHITVVSMDGGGQVLNLKTIALMYDSNNLGSLNTRY
jgi:hypothetical protein